MANRVEITVRARDDGTFRSAHDRINRLLRQLNRTVTARVRVEVTPPGALDRLKEQLDRVTNVSAARVRVQITPQGALADLRELRNLLTRVRNEITVKIKVTIDSIDAVRRLRRELDRIERRIRVRIDVDAAGGGAGGLAGTLRLLPSLAGGAVPALQKLTAAASAVGAATIAAAPHLIAVGREVLAVGRAATAAAPALAAWAVAGGVVAGTLKAILAEGRAMRTVLQPIADGLKRAGDNASNAAAKGLKPLVAEFQKAVWPEINHTMVQIGHSVNRVAKGFMTWVKSSEGMKAVNGILHPIWQAVGRLEPSITRLAISFTSMLGRIMGVAVTGDRLGAVFEKLAQKMDAVNAEGVAAGMAKLRSTASSVWNALKTLVEWVRRAVDAYMRFREQLGMLGTALSIVAIAFGGPISAIVGAISLVVINFDRLKAAYAAIVAYFRSSPWGASFMSNMRDAAGTVIPALVGSFRNFRTQVEPAIRAVGQFITTELIPAVGRLAAEAAPKIAAFAMALSNAASAVVPHVIEMFRQLREKVVPVLAEIADKIVNDLIPTLTRFVQAAAPVVAWFAETFGPVIVATVVNVANIIKGALDIIVGIFKVATALLRGDWQMLWDGIVSILQGAFGIVVAILKQLMTSATLVFQVGWAVVTAVVKTAVDAILSLFESLGSLASSLVGNMVSAIVGFFEMLGSAASAAVGWLVERIVAFFRWLYNTVVGGSIVPDLVNAIIRWFSNLAGTVPGIVASLAAAVVGHFLSLASRALAAVASLVTSVIDAFRRMMSGAASAISAGVGAVLGAVGRVRSAITGFFAGAGSWLAAAGRNIIQGLVNGIRSMAGAVAGAVGSIVSRARNLLPFSPAKEGPLSGRGSPDIAGAKIVEMLAAGVRSRTGVLQRALADALPAGGATAALARPSAAYPYGRAVPGPAAPHGAAGTPARFVLELRSSGRRVDDLLLEILRHAINVNGGDPVTVLRAR